MSRTYAVGDNLTAPNYNDDRLEIIAGVNSIINAQVADLAAIVESKLVFSGSTGHAHAGGVSGKKVLATNLDVTGLTASTLLQVNSAGTAIESTTGSLSPVSLDFTGFTHGYPLALNSAGDNMETRLLVNADISASAGIDYSKLYLTGSIVDADISALAAIDYSKLYLTGGIVNADVSASAGIEESKITFDTSAGHHHDGIDSRLVTGGGGGPTPRSYFWYYAGDLIVTSVTPRYYVDAAATVTYAYGTVSIGPTGDDILVDIYKKAGELGAPVLIGTLLIYDGIYTGVLTIGNTLAVGDLLYISIRQVGSTVVGSNLSLTLSCTTI